MIEGLSNKENELVLRALREYSESCEPPELIPECPFSVTIAPNERGCLEECMDLLGKHEAPRPRRTVTIESGIQVRLPIRPRSRRARDPVRPFDAKEIFLQDSSRTALMSWRLPALLYCLRESVIYPPDSSHATNLSLPHTSEVISSLERRGLDFDNIVEPSLRDYAGRAVFGRVYPQWSSNRSSISTPVVNAWVALLDSILLPTINMDGPPHDNAITLTARERADKAYRYLLKSTSFWAHTASFEDILTWNPPDALEYGNRAQDNLTEFQNSRWLFDRFTVTYLDDWRTESLRREWGYSHGERGCPWPSNEMKTRTIAQSQLAQVIADRLLRIRERSHVPSLTNQMVEPALEFINEGRRVEAAALFEAALRHDGEDVAAHNNLAFCLIPDQPELALEKLNKAIKLGGPAVRLYGANRILTLAYLGNIERVRALAVEFIKEEPSRVDRLDSSMWAVQPLLCNNEAEICKCDDLREYVESVLTCIDLD